MTASDAVGEASRTGRLRSAVAPPHGPGEPHAMPRAGTGRPGGGADGGDDRRHPGVRVGHGDAVERQRREEAVFGFWIFMMSDAVLFALLFATYAAMLSGTADGPGPGDVAGLANAFAETVLLLFSSVAFGLGTVRARLLDGRGAALWIVAAAGLGLAFLGLEVRELGGLVTEGSGPSRSGYLSAFHVLLGTHGLHVATGFVWIAVMLVQMRRLGLTHDVLSRLVRLGLFWHFLDIVWIGIISVVYLPGALL